MRDSFSLGENLKSSEDGGDGWHNNVKVFHITG